MPRINFLSLTYLFKCYAQVNCIAQQAAHLAGTGQTPETSAPMLASDTQARNRTLKHYQWTAANSSKQNQY